METKWIKIKTRVLFYDKFTFVSKILFYLKYFVIANGHCHYCYFKIEV